MTKDKSLIKHSEYLSILNDTEALNRAVANSTYVLVNEEQFTTEITSNLKGISESDVNRILRGSEIVGAKKRKFYCPNVAFLYNLIRVNDKG